MLWQKTANNCAGKLLFILSVEKNSKKKENGFAMFLHKKERGYDNRAVTRLEQEMVAPENLEDHVKLNELNQALESARQDQETKLSEWEELSLELATGLSQPLSIGF